MIESNEADITAPSIYTVSAEEREKARRLRMNLKPRLVRGFYYGVSGNAKGGQIL